MGCGSSGYVSLLDVATMNGLSIPKLGSGLVGLRVHPVPQLHQL
jgi:hypothetical protein